MAHARVASAFRELLHAKSYKATPARLAVLMVLQRATKPLSVAEIKRTLGRGAWDQATVYRTVECLRGCGLIKQIDFQRGLTYYELASLQEHHHAICVECARVADVADCCQEEAMHRQALAQSGFAEIKQHSLEFFGICSTCKNK